jgi:hypothetical protein
MSSQTSLISQEPFKSKIELIAGLIFIVPIANIGKRTAVSWDTTQNQQRELAPNLFQNQNDSPKRE